MSAEAINLCPFCDLCWGTTIRQESPPRASYQHFWVVCSACGTHGPKSESVTGAIEGWNEAVQRRVALDCIALAARVILDVAKSAPLMEAWTCPHGNDARWPTPGWWCDGCFGKLEDALEAAGVKEGAWREEVEQNDG